MGLNDILKLISDISVQISHNPDINLVLDSVLNNIETVLNTSRTSIMFPDEKHEFLYIKAYRGFDKEIVPQIKVPFGSGISGYVAKTKEPLLLKNANDFEKFGIYHDPMRYKRLSAISIPMLYKGRLLGVLNLNDKKGHGEFSELDFLAARIIANQAAVAANNSVLFQHYLEKIRLKQSILVAREIQQHFLPKQAPHIDGFDLVGWGKTCDETGGDYYDFYHFFDHSLAVVIGDVAGHGIGAALVMASARAALHAYTEYIDDLGEVFFKLNNLMMSNLEYANFMTMLLLLLDKKNYSFRYISAGHEGPILYTARDKKITSLPSNGLVLGILDDVTYTISEPVKMEKGDFVVLITDGLYEIHNPEGNMLGKKNLIKFIHENADLEASELKRKIIEFWENFKKDCLQEDDISLIILKKV